MNKSQSSFLDKVPPPAGTDHGLQLDFEGHEIYIESLPSLVVADTVRIVKEINKAKNNLISP
jgi:hypothetical protein